MILVIQHAEPETMGLLEPLCRDGGIAWHLCKPYAGEPVPPATQPYDGLVVLGGPMNADETDRYPFLKDEVKLFQQSLRRELPALGICLGAQLMAKAAGSRVYRGSQPEIGWFPIQLSEAARQDPLLEVFPQEMAVFHWHGDTYDLPAKAVHLASSQRYPQQAFRIGTQAYGLQFHIEVTPEIVERWAQETSSTDPAPLRSGLAEYGAQCSEYGRLYLSRFLEKVKVFYDEKNSD
ncbi:MAG: gamma-glutamyl-gamma-aminobutyrate hydrolase family protein [Candidatus Omnitrophica bacterium]|nr:gamma-glutamyl-gamma-aminobutyrate hydrolase family protein [Candidatus Omnitrophota bacterium]